MDSEENYEMESNRFLALLKDDSEEVQQVPSKKKHKRKRKKKKAPKIDMEPIESGADLEGFQLVGKKKRERRNEVKESGFFSMSMLNWTNLPKELLLIAFRETEVTYAPLRK